MNKLSRCLYSRYVMSASKIRFRSMSCIGWSYADRRSIAKEFNMFQISTFDIINLGVDFTSFMSRKLDSVCCFCSFHLFHWMGSM